MNWRRLHPLTILKELGALAWAIVGALVFDFGDTAELPEGIPDPDTLVAGGVFAFAVARYMFTSYRLTDRTLDLRRGILVKTLQTMPRDRIQSVGINTGLVGRFVGVTSVEVSAADTEDIKLSFVSDQDAGHLRRLLDPTQAADEAEPASSEIDQPDYLNRIEPGSLVVYGLTESALVVAGLVLVVTIGVAVVVGFMFAPLAVVPMAGLPVVRAINLVGFRSWIEDNRVKVVRGLLSRRETDAPIERIQAVHVGRPLTRRMAGYETVDMATGDVNVSGDDMLTAGMVAPLVEIGEWRAIARRLIGDVVLGETDLRPSSPYTVRRTVVRWVAASAVVAGLVTVPTVLFDLAALIPLTVLAVGVVCSLVYARMRYKVLGWAADTNHLMVRRGVVTRSLTVVPIRKVQDVEVRATFFQRRLGIASVVVDTAGVAIAGQVKAIDLDADDARNLAEHLARTAARIALPDGV